MARVETRLEELGLVLPGPVQAPAGARLPFVFARLDGQGFIEQPKVINGFSDLILELYGPEAGQHARSAVGLAELPFGIAVEIEAEVAID